MLSPALAKDVGTGKACFQGWHAITLIRIDPELADLQCCCTRVRGRGLLLNSLGPRGVAPSIYGLGCFSILVVSTNGMLPKWCRLRDPAESGLCFNNANCCLLH